MLYSKYLQAAATNFLLKI